MSGKKKKMCRRDFLLTADYTAKPAKPPNPQVSNDAIAKLTEVMVRGFGEIQQTNKILLDKISSQQSQFIAPAAPTAPAAPNAPTAPTAPAAVQSISSDQSGREIAVIPSSLRSAQPPLSSDLVSRSFQPPTRAVHDSTVQGITVQDSTVQYENDSDQNQPTGDFFEEDSTEVEKVKMDKLKAQQVRLCSMSRDVSKQLATINENKDKQDDTANANFLKVLNEKVNQNDAKMTNLLRRIIKLETDNKILKEKLDEQIYNKHQVPIPPTLPSTQMEAPKTDNKRRQIPIVDISPGEGERDLSDKPPPISWAFVVNRGFKKQKPKEQVPEEVLETYPEIIPKDIENPEHKVVYTEEENDMIIEELENSSKKIGLKPITQKEIDREANRITDNFPNINKRDIMIIAIKNCVTQFMKVNLKIDESTRNSIKIKKLYQNSKDDPDTIYIQCETKDDISKITSRANQLPRKVDDDIQEPTIVTHIPQMFYKRFQDCEKLLWQIRMTEKGAYQTNIRLGKADLVIRCRRKSGGHKWNEVPPLLIPHSVAKPDIKYYKDNIIHSQETEKPREEVQPKVSHWLDNQPINTNSMNGTITGHLEKQTEKNKRKQSPTTQTTKKPKTSIQPESTVQQPKVTEPPGPPTDKDKMISPEGSNWFNDMEVDSNVLDLIEDSGSKGFTIIPKLIGDKQMTENTNISITKILPEAMNTNQHE